MSDLDGDRSVHAGLVGSAQDFAEFCEAEFDRRRNATEAFNESDYREAMEMVVARLSTLEAEGES